MFQCRELRPREPDDAVSRAEMAAVLFNLIHRNGADGLVEFNGYADTAGHWAEEKIAHVQAHGYMVGYADGSFRPDQPLTRAEAVRVLNLLFDRPQRTDIKQPTWPDVPLTHWASADIESASATFTIQK